jgi:hypothetical protein
MESMSLFTESVLQNPANLLAGLATLVLPIVALLYIDLLLAQRTALVGGLRSTRRCLNKEGALRRHRRCVC